MFGLEPPAVGSCAAAMLLMGVLGLLRIATGRPSVGNACQGVQPAFSCEEVFQRVCIAPVITCRRRSAERIAVIAIGMVAILIPPRSRKAGPEKAGRFVQRYSAEFPITPSPVVTG